MQKWEKLLKTQWPIRLVRIRLSRLPGAESHDAYHVPEGIEIVLGSGIQVVPQLEHVIWKETNKENCQAQLVCYPMVTPRLRVRVYTVVLLTHHKGDYHASHMTTGSCLAPALYAQLLAGHVSRTNVQPFGHHDVQHADDGQWQQVVYGRLGNYHISAVKRRREQDEDTENGREKETVVKCKSWN